MGAAPLAQGLPAPTAGLSDLPCMLDPTLTTNQFNILAAGSNFVPLVSQSGDRLRPLPSPTSEAAAKALRPADSLVLPAFVFQKSSTAGIYDIVLAGNTPQYIAKTATGALVLTDSSPGTTITRRNGQSIITSIFGVDCKGRITVTQAGQSHAWSIHGATTTFTAGSSSKTMVVYSLQRKSTTRKVRKSIYTEDAAPRCPNSPADLSAKVFPGARGLNPNGCGPSNGFDFVPDFSFGSCCDGHDNCYDNCEKGTFEGCNNDFHQRMRTTECDYLDHWYSYVPRLSCLKSADFYAWTVGGSTGREAFHGANKERCGCYCSAAQGLCGRSNVNTGDQAPDPVNYQCTSMFGTDVNNWSVGRRPRQHIDRLLTFSPWCMWQNVLDPHVPTNNVEIDASIPSPTRTTAAHVATSAVPVTVSGDSATLHRLTSALRYRAIQMVTFPRKVRADQRRLRASTLILQIHKHTFQLEVLEVTKFRPKPKYALDRPTRLRSRCGGALWMAPASSSTNSVREDGAHSMTLVATAVRIPMDLSMFRLSSLATQAPRRMV